MEFENILQPLLDAGMIQKMDRSTDTIDVYDYTPKSLELIGTDSNWHFCNVTKNESPASLRVWLPSKRRTDGEGESFGGFHDVDRYSYIKVKEDPAELNGTEFEDRIKEFFDGVGIPYDGFTDDYIELDDLCL